VAWDEPQVRIGSLLDRYFLDTILVKVLSSKEAHKKGAQKKKEE
jgi:hypothetical protein